MRDFLVIQGVVAMVIPALAESGSDGFLGNHGLKVLIRRWRGSMQIALVSVIAM
jgi:hypothetical protein